MAAIRDYVSCQPGCSKAAALRGVGLPDRGIGYLRPVERTIGAGLVIAEPYRPGYPTRLYANETDRQLWHLRAELLGSPSLERAEEIAAEVEAIRQAQAAGYAEAQEGSGQ